MVEPTRAPQGPHPLELALAALLLVLEAAWLLARTMLVPLVALLLTATGPRPTARHAQVLATAPHPPIPASSRPCPPHRHPLQPLVLEPLQQCTVAQLRQRARAAGMPRHLTRSARKAELVNALAGLAMA